MQITIVEKTDRIDKYLALKLNLPRTKIKELIETKNILVNNNEIKPKYIPEIGDIITIKNIDEKEITKENIKLNIIYEDEDIIVIDKESGIVVHPGSGNETGTLVNALLNHTNKLSDINGDKRRGIIHRLDKDTSGLIVVAKNNKAHENLAEQFKEKKVIRKYIALCTGVIEPDTGVINAPIGRDPRNRKRMTVIKDNSKEAITNFKVIKRYDKYTLVEFSLVTGRTHQIRVHSKFINHPVYNDPLYTDKDASKFNQYLHSSNLEFKHPTTKKEMKFTSELPKEIKAKINNLENR